MEQGHGGRSPQIREIPRENRKGTGQGALSSLVTTEALGCQGPDGRGDRGLQGGAEKATL